MLPQPTPHDDARLFCFRAGWHHYGDTRVTFANGGQIDLAEALADFADQIIKERNNYQKLALDILSSRLPTPVIIDARTINADRHSS